MQIIDIRSHDSEYAVLNYNGLIERTVRCNNFPFNAFTILSFLIQSVYSMLLFESCLESVSCRNLQFT